ncbi:uncharacterized protein LOC127136827 [Lathyrus oleraceus]|uniref:uncharacterized protein LOC127136827 n=1 Tax=Pisum sativum TaxID=3888 RepID=UPI0021CE45BC|nr:uncharacterized protein LOC127136827 [Pisum sativum]
MVMVNRQQDADQIVDQHRQEDLAVENNLTTIVERIMARNGMGATLQRPLYISPLAEFILQAETPRGMKVPKYTKFGGESGESIIEHVARYLTESWDLAHNECLRVKNFPSSLTKASFTWFTSLAPSSINSWAKLEKKLHEQFYEGYSKISLAELSSIKRRFVESIDDYLNRFRSLKARCFTQVPEHELVQMAVGGLDYSIRKKIDPTFVKSMSQLVDRVRHLERLRLEKIRHNKSEKEKVAFVEYDTTDPIRETDYPSSTELEIDVAELKSGSAYECRSLLPTQGKNPVENNPKFPSKTYTFDVLKCEEIFDLLVKDGQMVVPPAIQEGRLKFAGRRMKIDIDPLHQEETLFVESVEISEYDEANMLEKTGESPDVDIAEVYPMADEDLVDFLYRCKNKDSQVCLCPRCGVVTDKIAAENFQKLQLGKSKRNVPTRGYQNERG